jgi:serine/threonine protein kinase
MLSAAQMARMSELLDEALQLDEAGRRRWLEALASEHRELEPALRDALLGEGAKALKTLPKVEKHPVGSGVEPGQLVGPYRLIRILGSGGMAEVWLASRADGAFQREVALKLPMQRAELSSRFGRERDILASLEHPNIARLYDGGVTAEGLSYLAMEYVTGRPLTPWCDAHSLGIEPRLRLFLQVLDAVEYAHSHGVIHRDIKPSNVLVTAEGQVRLLDFGVARLLEQRREQTNLTQVYGRALTPEYASPELIRGDAVEAASDIYALGVMLYELLSGSRPYHFKSSSSVDGLQQAMSQVEVPPPSERVGADTGSRRGVSRPKLAGLLKGDLDAIVLKALAKDPEQRYGSAQALSEDLHRYLSGQPVGAHRDSLLYRQGKFWMRNKAAAAIGGAGLILASVAAVFFHSKSTAPADRPATQIVARSSTAEPQHPTMSLAVLHFDARSQDAATVHMAEELPRRISISFARTPALTLLPADRDTVGSRGDRSSPTKLSAAARYLAQGEVRSGNDGYTVGIRLVDASTGGQVWSTNFTLPELDGSFNASARLHKLSALIFYAVRNAEIHRVLNEPIEGLDAKELVLRGVHLWDDDPTLKGVLEAKRLLELAVQKDPSQAWAMSLRGFIWDSVNDVDPHIDRRKMLEEMDTWTQRAINMDPTYPSAWRRRSQALADMNQLAAATEAIDRAINLDPFEAEFFGAKAWLMNMWGRPEQAFALAQHAMDLDPDDMGFALRVSCEAHLLLGRYEQAIADCEKSAGVNFDWFVTSFLAAAYANRGDMRKAIAAKDAILRVVPGYTIAQLRDKHYSQEPAYLKMVEATWYEGLHKAGIPEQ